MSGRQQRVKQAVSSTMTKIKDEGLWLLQPYVRGVHNGLAMAYAAMEGVSAGKFMLPSPEPTRMNQPSPEPLEESAIELDRLKDQVIEAVRAGAGIAIALDNLDNFIAEQEKNK